MMRLDTLRALLARSAGQDEDDRVMVCVFNPGSVGPTPAVHVSRVQAGFDWDRGRLLIYPDTPLTALTPEQVEAILESVRKGQSWHSYQAVKAMHEKLKASRADNRKLRKAIDAVLMGTRVDKDGNRDTDGLLAAIVSEAGEPDLRRWQKVLQEALGAGEEV